jgi:hypothetical protein
MRGPGLACSPRCARALIAANRRTTTRSPNRIAEALAETRASVAGRIATGRKIFVHACDIARQAANPSDAATRGAEVTT